MQPSPVDSASFPFLRLLLHAGPPGSEEERMYETEAAQLVRRSTNRELVDGFHDFVRGAALPRQGRPFAPIAQSRAGHFRRPRSAVVIIGRAYRESRDYILEVA